MKLVNSELILKNAVRGRYAVGAFNIYNLETLKAVVKAAGEMNSPIILQTTPRTVSQVGEDYISAMTKVAAAEYGIPVILHLDHGDSFEIVVKCIRAGYTAVMIDGSSLPYEDNITLTRKVVELAHSVGVSVEAELGEVTGVEDDLYLKGDKGRFTKPEIVPDFIERTGVDSLAVAIGTAHGKYKGEIKLDFDRLERIRSLVDIPLVLHGASGVPDKDIKKAIKFGINKINIATEIKIAFTETIKGAFKKNQDKIDPRNYLASVEKRIEQIVKNKITLFGCGGKA